MTRDFESPIPRVLAGALLCWLAASTAWAPGAEPGAAPQPDRGRRVVVVWGGGSDASRGVPASERSGAIPASAEGAGSQAFRDPESGRFVEPPPDQLLEVGPRSLRAALSTSAEGLVEEPVAASPGGVRVNLRGRFRSALVAERSPDGGLTVECAGTGAGADSAGAASPAVGPSLAAGGAR